MAIYSDIAVVGKQSVNDQDSLLQAVRSLLNTSRGERIFLPEYGCDLEQFQYKVIDSWNTEEVRFHIQQTLEQDNRISIKEIVVTPNQDENRYDIKTTIEFKGVESSVTMALKSKVV